MHNKLLRKSTQRPAPLSVPVFAQRFHVPPPQGVKFSPISQNGLKIFPPCTFFRPNLRFPKNISNGVLFYVKCVVTHLIFSFNRNRLLSFITDKSSVSCVKALLTRFQSRVGLPSFHKKSRIK